MPKLFIPVGIPGCGKTTWCRTMFDADFVSPGAAIVSSDAIRLELFGGRYDQTRNAEVFDTFHSRIKENLECGSDVVADATSLTASSRARLRDIAAYVGEVETHVILFTNVEQAVRRNVSRGGNAVVPTDAMTRMLDKYEQTCLELPYESYTSVTYIGGLE